MLLHAAKTAQRIQLMRQRFRGRRRQRRQPKERVRNKFATLQKLYNFPIMVIVRTYGYPSRRTSVKRVLLKLGGTLMLRRFSICSSVHHEV